MLHFVQRHADKVTGVLHGFDRLRFRGTLRNLMFIEGMSEFLWRSKVLLKDFKTYFTGVTRQVKAAIEQTAQQAGRPVHYQASSNTDKEAIARKIAAADHIEEGLICVLSCIENCQSFEVRPNRKLKQLELRFVPRKCLHYYFYMQHPRFGFMHVRFQSWFPFDVRSLHERPGVALPGTGPRWGWLRATRELFDRRGRHRVCPATARLTSRGSTGLPNSMRLPPWFIPCGGKSSERGRWTTIGRWTKANGPAT